MLKFYVEADSLLRGQEDEQEEEDGSRRLAVST